MPDLVQQIIDDRYIDRNRLMNLLSRKFPAGTYLVEVALLYYTVKSLVEKILRSTNACLHSGNSTDSSSPPLKN